MQAILYVLIAGGLAALAAFGVRKFGSADGYEGNNEAVGQVFTLIAGLQAVIAAFLLISILDGNSAVEDLVTEEANGLTAVVWAGDSLPQPAKDQIRAGVNAYTREVVTDEWPLMASAGEQSDQGPAALARIRTAISTAPTTTDWERSQQVEAANQLWNVYQARQQRLDAAGGKVSDLMAIALVLGAVFSVGLALMFGGPRLISHMVIVGSFAAVNAFIIYAIFELKNPFSGGSAVTPDAFTSVLERLT